jgi:hypothetical protein
MSVSMVTVSDVIARNNTASNGSGGGVLVTISVSLPLVQVDTTATRSRPGLGGGPVVVATVQNVMAEGNSALSRST